MTISFYKGHSNETANIHFINNKETMHVNLQCSPHPAMLPGLLKGRSSVVTVEVIHAPQS
jgi:hypothetical protein